MPNLRNKVNKRKSDSFVIENDKAIKRAKEAKDAKEAKEAKVKEIKRCAQVPMNQQLKAIKEAHEALNIENKNNLKLIERLKEELNSLKSASEKFKSRNKVSKESQTSPSEDFTCNACIFLAKSTEELEVHVKEKHSQAPHGNNFICNVCSEVFDAKRDLMAHRKLKHCSSLKTCTYFLRGICDFGQDCWFGHIQSDQGSHSPNTLKEYNCGFCGKIFENKKKFMEHRKNEHINNVKECDKNKNASCEFGENMCWYKHEKDIQNTESEIGGVKTVDLVKRLFDMMESFAERMRNIENQI